MSEENQIRAEPVAAEEVSEGECAYRDCDADADLRVEFRASADVRETALMCDSCSRTNRIHARANDLLDHEVQS